ncbi:TPA: CO dehydrogenase/CO-methylating acetyl-CoA synthase complex subunit beta, partial [Candidatus Bathyarchaeota archaeon]|nr:CO dehydrogenase/CO-methylating acetyl-CoA synthase complex subunit beta [Candidatus Bathyarchaeota archaeon]
GKVKEKYEEAMKTYEQRDARARGLRDEEVDVFYGCTLCQSFAPTHVCVITPQRYSNCGAISWFDGRAAARVDPKGPVFMIEKGKCVDPFRGEFLGVNESVKSKSGGEITRVWLYTAFGYPHTSCGCFEGVAFYIPEVDGIGIVHRGFQGTAPNGLSFSTLADSTAGGRQVDGFHGISIEYMRSRKFLQADGGWDRIVWLPESLKERVKGFVSDDLLEKIPTEKQVTTIEGLKAFLEEKGHPVVERWKAMAEEEIEEKVEEKEAEELVPAQVSLMGSMVPEGIAFGAGGFRIVLKNVKIHAKKVRIKRREK